MSSTIITILKESQRLYATSLVAQMPKGAQIVFKPEPTRTDLQNKKMWPMLTDVSQQVVWHGHKLKPEEWKDVFTAGLKNQKCVPGIDGGLVFIGAKTSNMRVSEFCDLIEIIYQFGANPDHPVKWSEKAKDVFATERKAA